RQKSIRVDPKRRRLTAVTPRPEFAHPLERLVYAVADSAGGSSVANVHSYAQGILAWIADTLKSEGLVVPNAEATRAILITMGIALGGILVGLIKILIGVSRDKPVGFLVAICVISFILALAAFARRPLRSLKGDAVLRRLKQQHRGSPYIGRNAADFSS